MAPAPGVRLAFAPGEPLPGVKVSLADLARRRSLAVVFYNDLARLGAVDAASARGGARAVSAAGRAAELREVARAQAWQDHDAVLAELGYEVVGISAQSAEAQAELVTDWFLGYTLLSDTKLLLARELGLPTRAMAGGKTAYEPLTMLVSGGHIARVFYPIDAPVRDAAIVTEVVRSGRV